MFATLKTNCNFFIQISLVSSGKWNPPENGIIQTIELEEHLKRIHTHARAPHEHISTHFVSIQRTHLPVKARFVFVMRSGKCRHIAFVLYICLFRTIRRIFQSVCNFVSSVCSYRFIRIRSFALQFNAKQESEETNDTRFERVFVWREEIKKK